MENKESCSNIYNEILEIEKKYSLFNEKIDGVYFWKLLRVNLINEIILEKGLVGEAHAPKKKELKIILENIVDNLLKKQKKIENLIFSHDRFFIDNNEFKDIYTYKIYEMLSEKSEIVYPVLTKKIFKNKGYNFSSIENVSYVLNFLKKDIINNKIKLTLKEEKKIEKIKLEIEKKLELHEIKILKKEEVLKKIYHFKNMVRHYKKYLRKKNPKRIYIVCSYGKESLIAAAKELNLEVVEIQHGLMSKYHFGYNFPNNSYIPYFPDKILMFGEYWSKVTSLPLPKENIKIIGYPYMKDQIEKYQDSINQNVNQVLFISQGTVGIHLTKKAIEFALENIDLKVIIKLHPGEFLNWKEKYKFLYENKNLPNLEISDNNKKNLYEYLCESKYIIGVYSTVIYEALYLEKKIGIINCSGIEHVEDLINQNYVKKIELEEKINIKDLENLEKAKGEYYFYNKRELEKI